MSFRTHRSAARFIHAGILCSHRTQDVTDSGFTCVTIIARETQESQDLTIVCFPFKINYISIVSNIFQFTHFTSFFSFHYLALVIIKDLQSKSNIIKYMNLFFTFCFLTVDNLISNN